MRTNKSAVIFITVLFFIVGGILIFVPSEIRGAPGTIYVDDNASCPCWYDATHVRTIQEGIDNATAGDTVFVYSGTYHESVDINKTVDLIGENRNTTLIEGSVQIYHEWVNVSGFNTYTIVINASNVSIFNNIIHGGEYNILIYSDFNTIRNNRISNSKNGTALWGSSNNLITRNVYIDNYVFGVGGYGNNNTVFHNTFINNNPSGIDGTNNIWHDGYPSGGNYWSDFDEPSEGAWDNNSDGIVDSPYTINPWTSDQDLYPLMHPFGSVTNLDTSEVFLMIQAAIDDVDTLDGHTIFVKNGTYYGNIIVNKTVSLIGEDKNATIVGDGTRYAIVHITADHVSLSGFTIRCDWNEDEVLLVYLNASHATIANNIIKTGENSINIYSSMNNTITGNTLSNANVALALTYSDNNTILGNTVTDNNMAIELHISSNNTIADNNLTLNTNTGLFLHTDCDNNIITGNNISNNGWDGIELFYSSSNIIVGNNISFNGEWGMRVSSYSKHNSIYHNVLLNNNRNANDKGKNNSWDNGYPSGGNYWSDFDEPSEGAYDNGSDGIIDSQYNVSWGSSIDRYPLTIPWNTSAKNISACRDIFPESLGPGQTFTVSVTLLAHEDATGPALDEDVPSEWTVTPIDNAGFIYKSSTTEWLFLGAWNAGDNAIIIYEVTIPPSTPYAQYFIAGVVSAYKAGPYPVGCDSTVNVVEDWNPWDNDAVITTMELQEIVNHWTNDISKNGHFVTTSDLQEMIFMWLNS